MWANISNSRNTIKFKGYLMNNEELTCNGQLTTIFAPSRNIANSIKESFLLNNKDTIIFNNSDRVSLMSFEFCIKETDKFILFEYQDNNLTEFDLRDFINLLLNVARRHSLSVICILNSNYNSERKPRWYTKFMYMSSYSIEVRFITEKLLFEVEVLKNRKTTKPQKEYIIPQLNLFN